MKDEELYQQLQRETDIAIALLEYINENKEWIEKNIFDRTRDEVWEFIQKNDNIPGVTSGSAVNVQYLIKPLLLLLAGPITNLKPELGREILEKYGYHQ